MQERKKRERVQIMFAREELAAIDHFRFDRGIATRARAVRELLRRGLTVDDLQLGHKDEISSGPRAGRKV